MALRGALCDMLYASDRLRDADVMAAQMDIPIPTCEGDEILLIPSWSRPFECSGLPLKISRERGGSSLAPSAAGNIPES